MFQSVSNPLVLHTRNPNAPDDSTAEEVPSLTQSQIRLKAKNDRVSNTLFVLIGLLVALLAVTVGFILFDKVQRDEGLIDAAKEVTREDSEVISPIEEEEDKGAICKGCISYLKLKSLASQSIEDAERYVNTSIAQATSAPAGEAPRDLTNLTDVITRFSDLGQAKERAAELDEKIREFLNSLKSAQDAEKSSGDLKARYRQRAATLERLADELVNYFTNTIGIAERREQLENEISTLRAQIDARNVEWGLAKGQIKNRIQIIKDSLRKEYEAAGVSNEAELDVLIAKALADAEKCKTDAADCVRNVESNRIKINAYVTELEQLQEAVDNIDHQIGLKNWINHVLSAMAKFETVKRQLKLLQETQLRQGRENITELIQSLEQRERELTRWIVDGLEKNVITKEELDLISDTTKAEEVDGTNFDAISKVSSINKAKVLRLYIKKEQDLLKAWSRQQLDTFELSQKEYNNITETINAYNQSIQGHTEELESFRIQREEKLVRIVRVTELKKELEDSVAACEEAINKSQELYDKEATELARLRAIKDKIREINQDLAKENAELTSTDNAYGKEINELQAKIRDFQNQLASLTEGRALDEAKLRKFVEDINGLIIRGPKTEEVEKKVGDAREQVRNTTDTYGEVVRLRDQVKEYLNK